MQVMFEAADIAPIVEQTVAAMLDRFGAADRIAYSESEAAALFGVAGHVLRDARLRGELTGAKIGRSHNYTRSDLLAWYESRRATS